MTGETKIARKIKKYANRKLYDTVQKRYISLDGLADLIQSGEEVVIEENETGEDITISVLTQLLMREKKDSELVIAPSILAQLMQKGRGTVEGFAKRSSGIWQSAMTLAEDEIDKIVNLLVRNKEITESEGSRLKKELTGYTENFKKWIGEKVDQRVSEVMGMMNLATREQVEDLHDKIDGLAAKIREMESTEEKGEKP